MIKKHTLSKVSEANTNDENTSTSLVNDRGAM